MEHHHHHHRHHHHSIDLKKISRAFVIGIVLNFLFVLIEVIVGLSINSLSLLSDAGHNLADVVSLSMSLFVIRLAKVKPTDKYTYGYKKTTIIVALFNAFVLLVSIGAISYEALHRIIDPEPLPGETISIVAGIGIVINTVTALLFLSNKDKDLNIKSAFMHLLADAIVSAGIVIGGIIIYYTGIFRIDAVLSLVVATIILLSTWKLLKDSLRLSLDGVPDNIDLRKVKRVIGKISGIRDFHHIHIWAISTTENALTGHIVVAQNSSMQIIENIKHEVKHQLQHLKIEHATLEVEMENIPCEEPDCDKSEEVGKTETPNDISK
jgi:cobalt-zinc-cadmium efflux system protein